MNKLITTSLLLVVIYSSCTFDTNIQSENTEINIAQEIDEDIPFIPSNQTKIPFEDPYSHHFVEFENCNNFLGSKLKIMCKEGAYILEEIYFEGSITNIEKWRDSYIVLLKDGQLLQFDIKTKNKKLLLNLESKTYRDGDENGLLDIAFSPNSEEFVLSYINNKNKLIFEIFTYKDTPEVIKSNQVLLEVSSSTNSHYGGKVIWSKNLNCFIGSIGDMAEANFNSRLNSSPLNTNTFQGKILGLNCNENLFDKKINISKSQNKATDSIVAFGLRNPWQFFEFRDNLVVFDTGFTQNEELNIVKIHNFPLNFGWPVFEGPKRAEDLDNIKNYELDIFYWEDDLKLNAVEYVETNSILPTFYYNHLPCNSNEGLNCDGKTDIYRAAIIGGDIFENSKSNYNFEIFFADYISQELFSLDFLTRDVTIYPIEGLLFVNSVKVYDSDDNQIITTTNDGKIYIIQLPNY